MADILDLQRGEKPNVFVKEFKRDHEPRPELDANGKPTGKVTMQEIVWCTYAPRGVAGRDIDIKWHQLKRHNPAVYEALSPAYEHFMRGEQLPNGGTSLSSWSGVSAGQGKRFKEINVLSVEDIAAMNDAAMDRFGMGAREIKAAAKAWLDSREGAGIAHELTQLRERLRMQEEAMADMQADNETLRGRLGEDGGPKGPKMPRKVA